MVAPRKEIVLPTILFKYELNQIYNADEFDLFYWVQPQKSLNLKNDKFVGGKHSMIGQTG